VEAKSTTPLATKIVELVHTPLGLGLSLDCQYKVVAIAHGSQAQRSDSFAVHDQLISLNGQPLNGSVSFEEQLRPQSHCRGHQDHHRAIEANYSN
jgi:hypothetical protein